MGELFWNEEFTSGNYFYGKIFKMDGTKSCVALVQIKNSIKM